MVWATKRSEFEHFSQRTRAERCAVVARHTLQTLAPVGQSNLEFVILSDVIHMPVRGKILTHKSSALDSADSTPVFNNLLHSLFSQCSVTLNGVSVLSYKDL